MTLNWHPQPANQHQRHLEERASVQMTNAATNTAELCHLRALSTASPLEASVNLESKRRRGPKASKKSLGAALGPSSSAQWSRARSDLHPAGGDPYAFHCDSMTMSYEASVPSELTQFRTQARHDSVASPRKLSRYLSGPDSEQATLRASDRQARHQQAEPVQQQDNELTGKQSSFRLQFNSIYQNKIDRSQTEEYQLKEPKQTDLSMIAHKQHPVPSNQSGRPKQPMYATSGPHQHHQLALNQQTAHDQHYYPVADQYGSSGPTSASGASVEQHQMSYQRQQPMGPGRFTSQVGQQQQYHDSVNTHNQAQQPQVPSQQLTSYHQQQTYEQHYAPEPAGISSRSGIQQRPQPVAQVRAQPYPNHQQPVRATQRVPNQQQQQYKTAAQIPAAPPQLMSPNSANYPNATNAYPVQVPFVHDTEQYPSISPNLLKQQLNRQLPATQAPMSMSQPQRAGYAPLGHKLARRYEPDGIERQQQQQQANNNRLQPPPPVYYNNLRSPAPAPQPRVQRGPQMVPAMQEPHSHLLGNLTPPLTPTNTHLPGGRVSSSLQADSQQQWQQQQHHGHLHDHVQQQQLPVTYNGSSSINKQSMSHHLQHNEANGQHPPMMPKNANNSSFQHQYANNGVQQHHVSGPTSPMGVATPNGHYTSPHQANLNNFQGVSHQAPTNPTSRLVGGDLSPAQTRLTLPLRDATLLGPFRLDHDAKFTSKVFHIKPQLFETLSKSSSLNPQAATVIQELQFRAYLVKAPSTSGDSLLASNNHPTMAASKQCNWPELFQLSVNQNLIHLDRPKVGPHRVVDIFQLCHLGDNVIDIQVNDCYCTHEFVLEAVDRPTLKAFMNSCFKSRLLQVDACIQKLKINFGSPGFLIQNHHIQQSTGICNEYITEFVQGIEQTTVRISLRCPISGRRMRTPARGYNCKHLQCFDLEGFLYVNRERSQWNCPLCLLSIPFNMLELDQHQINIVQSMSEIPNVDDILVDVEGQWRSYCQQQQPINNGPPISNQIPQHHQQQPLIQNTAKSTGTFHPQAPLMDNNSQMSHPINQQPMRPTSGPIRQALASWDNQPDNGAGMTPIRRPASALNQPGRRSASGSPLAKKPYSGQYSQQLAGQSAPISSTPSVAPPGSASGSNLFNGDQQAPISYNDNGDDLSPLAAMERTISQHEQQMGPPPFDPNSLTSSPGAPLRSLNGSAGSSMISPNASVSSNGPCTMIQPSPESRMNSQTAFSPLPHGLASPASRVIPASPQQQRPVPPSDLPQSPMQQSVQTSTSISTPATPSSSSILIHGGPETPATPNNPNIQQHCGLNSVQSVSHSPHIGSVGSVGSVQQTGVDHQPLSNGSASAGSITSSSTMTPSGQSLGSVGMGGDSRCGTAPLQGSSLGLDDLIVPNSLHSGQMSSQYKQSIHGNSSTIDDKNEILMGKLMMDSSESLLRDHRNGELATALEEAEWKKQLDRGKSEHLANFLNEPLMKKQQGTNSRMISGALSDDDGNPSHGSSPGENLEQLEYGNYLDADIVDNGAGLPPDDSILNLFER